MEFSVIRNWVGRFLQDTSFKYYGGDATGANRAINYAIKFVSTIIPYDVLGELQGLETEDIAEGDVVQYSLPSDFYWFKKAKWDGYWCEKLSIENIDLPDTNPFNVASETAPLCYICENKITYSPATDALENGRLLYYVKVAADLSGDTDENPLSSLLDYAVALKATEILASKHADDKRWADKFEREISNWRPAK